MERETVLRIWYWRAHNTWSVITKKPSDSELGHGSTLK